MTPDANSYTEMLRKFFSDLGLPKLDVDKLIDGRQRAWPVDTSRSASISTTSPCRPSLSRKFSK